VGAHRLLENNPGLKELLSSNRSLNLAQISELLYSKFSAPCASLKSGPVAANPLRHVPSTLDTVPLRAEDFLDVANTPVYRFFPSCRSALVAAKRHVPAIPAGQPFHAFLAVLLQLPDRLAALAAVLLAHAVSIASCFWLSNIFAIYGVAPIAIAFLRGTILSVASPKNQEVGRTGTTAQLRHRVRWRTIPVMAVGPQPEASRQNS